MAPGSLFSRNHDDLAKSQGYCHFTALAPAPMRSGLGAAIAATAVEAQAVALDREAHAPRGGFLECLQLVVAKLQDGVARRADHVVVMLVPEHMFEAPPAIAGIHALDEAGVFERLQRAIDGGARNMRVLTATEGQQLVGGEVSVRAKRGAHNGGALLRPAAMRAEVALDLGQFGFEIRPHAAQDTAEIGRAHV